MITFQSVSKQFGEDQAPALKDVSFEVDQGELVVITGPSGSGKTTLMRLLTREYEPSEGEIFFEEEPLSDIKNSQVHHHRRRIGVIFQDYKLLPELNIWENIALPLYITGKNETEIEERVTDLLNLVDLTNKAFLFPSQLSGGEAQRVSIARALATGPSVLFADEPTGNLDGVTTHTIAKLIQKIHELGTTVLLTTHDITVLDMLKGERVIKLDKGELIHDSKAGKAKKAHPKTETKETTKEADKTEEKTEPMETEAGAEATAAAPPKKGPRIKLPRLWPRKAKKAEPEADAKPETDSSEEKTVDSKNSKTEDVAVKVEEL